MAIDVQVMLDDVLTNPVLADGVNGVVLVAGQVFGLAVDGAAGGDVDDLLDAVGTAQLQQVDRALDVDVGVEERVGH